MRKIIEKKQIIGKKRSLLQHRKKLALNAQVTIKSEVAKKVLQKMKRVLFEEGVISHFTYQMMGGHPLKKPVEESSSELTSIS